MGVKQTTDVLEKGTWLFAAIIGVLCLASTFFISGSNDPSRDIGPNAPASNVAPGSIDPGSLQGGTTTLPDTTR
jgi:preprotein translocase subunit SecG